MKTNKDRFCNIRLTEEEALEIERQMKLTGITNRSKFIKALLFNKPIKVVSVDKNVFEYYKILVNIQSQYRAIGNNYNQATKAIKTVLTDKKALAFLYQLRDATFELIRINKEIIQLTKDFESKWLQK